MGTKFCQELKLSFLSVVKALLKSKISYSVVESSVFAAFSARLPLPFGKNSSLILDFAVVCSDMA